MSFLIPMTVRQAAVYVIQDESRIVENEGGVEFRARSRMLYGYPTILFQSRYAGGRWCRGDIFGDEFFDASELAAAARECEDVEQALREES